MHKASTLLPYTTRIYGHPFYKTVSSYILIMLGMKEAGKKEIEADDSLFKFILMIKKEYITEIEIKFSSL